MIAVGLLKGILRLAAEVVNRREGCRSFTATTAPRTGMTDYKSPLLDILPLSSAGNVLMVKR
jgi:hypothetical protein